MPGFNEGQRPRFDEFEEAEFKDANRGGFGDSNVPAEAAAGRIEEAEDLLRQQKLRDLAGPIGEEIPFGVMLGIELDSWGDGFLDN